MTYFSRQSAIIARAIMIGLYFWQHAKNHARDTSLTIAAKNLRKRGVPVALAVEMLCH